MNQSFDFRPITISIFRGLKETVFFLDIKFFSYSCLSIFYTIFSAYFYQKLILTSFNGAQTQATHKAGVGQTFVFTTQREVKFIC